MVRKLLNYGRPPAAINFNLAKNHNELHLFPNIFAKNPKSKPFEGRRKRLILPSKIVVVPDIKQITNKQGFMPRFVEFLLKRHRKSKIEKC
jgi:hypothetical protein